MESNLRMQSTTGSAVKTAELIVSSARLQELYECSALLRRTRHRAEEIVEEARMRLAEAEREGDAERVYTLSGQLDEARAAYCKVLNAYVAICRRINEERQDITTGDLSGVA
ncbi:hypothetical protein OIE66_36495 [Nonomuraea sp. NBC_01738]|uniref:hypothetical protein n=1 Tax=Nonomuraea sp. NBC_01738 TaxID=2976003 RepID=UPI002E137DA2|nr:hypothetical protein OIE66_36495 [Nonomuraea sp. NBC_01738]